MRTLPTRLSGLILIEPDVHADGRGFFVETFNPRFAELGVTGAFVQDNHSRSLKDTIRGLHYQASPGQAKLVRVARGLVWDVAVDIRPGSPTYGQWEAFELDDIVHRQLYIPVGFAHGFCVRSEIADVCYKVNSPYDRGLERGLAWDDPALGIPWPTLTPLLSKRDRQNPTLTEAGWQ